MINVLTYLEDSAKKFPEKTAVIDPNTRLTYAQLSDRARRVGSALAGETEPGRPVAVWMEKSAAALSVLFGAVYAGCFYVYMNPNHPPRRMQQILQVAEASVAVTDQPEQLRALGFAGKILDYEKLLETPIQTEKLQSIRDRALDIDPLYCNFTSGSTGVPKGVLVGHRSVIDFMDCFPELFGITQEDVIANQAPFDFDVSVKDIYSAMKTGATLVLIPQRMFSVVTQLLDYLCDNQVTTLIWAVSALCLVAQFKGLTYKVPETVRKILFSGEMMPVKYLRQWQKSLPNTEFVNLYGPTEITCNCTYYRVNREFADDAELPIGIPFPNEKVFLLDENNHLVEQPGQRGELCVSGTALAIGYYNNEEQTNRSFVQNPLNTRFPERIYRTGDLARYNEAGELCFCGRTDFQIKHMGHRIELEEIEAVLNSLPEVERACCLYDSQRKRLIGFYSGDIAPRDLKKSLYEYVAAYMVPSVLHQVDSLPVTANGKIDRKRLLETGEDKK